MPRSPAGKASHARWRSIQPARWASLQPDSGAYVRAGETYVIDVPFPAHFDAPNKRWLHEQGQITWAEVLTRWKARGPMNTEYVAALQRGWSPAE